MVLRGSHLGLRLIKPFTVARQCVRCFHKNHGTPRVPSPTPFVPDVQTFLTLIGRGMSKHAEKLSSWDKLFTLSSPELRDMGIEPARQRRYLLRKREKFRQGQHGPGGDLESVVDGVAQLRVVEIPRQSTTKQTEKNSAPSSSVTATPGTKKVIVNVSPDATEYQHDAASPIKKFAQMKIHQGSMIKGPFLEHLKGTNGSAALIKVQDGMWEDKQGHKVDGGERRQAEVRAKRRIEESKRGSA